MFVEESGKLWHRQFCPLASRYCPHTKDTVYIFKQKFKRRKEGYATKCSLKD